MATLIKSVKIVDKQSKHHDSVRDVLIQKGKIVDIKAKIEDNGAKIIDGKGLCLSPGWLDLRANFCDPGDEFKEDIQSGINAALHGGFTKVVLMPSTNPRVDSKTTLRYLQQQSEDKLCDLLPCAALSDKMEGHQLSEMYDMHHAGAVAFGDDKKPVKTELMHRALEYASNFNGLITSFPMEADLNPGGLMHEGAHSTNMGVKGIPSTAEEIGLQRDLSILRYTGGRMLVSPVSAAKSVAQIEAAQKDGLKVHASVAVMNLLFEDQHLSQFDTRLKVMPPFRTDKDRKALIQGVKSGVISAICSDHSPEDVESKKIEFEHAAFGISSIEHSFSLAWTVLEPHMPLADLVARFTSGPREILQLPALSIAIGQAAECTLFDPDAHFTVDTGKMKSKSKNSPLNGHVLKGKVVAVINKGKTKKL